MKTIKYSFWVVALFLTFQSNGQYFSNPILSGFYPDPSICKGEGNNYYMTVSTFAYFPGLPIFHSTDLVNWKQIGSALNRPEQLNLDGQGVSRGLFAPAITYHNGTYYIICTNIDKGGNFIVTAKDPAGPWSNPVWVPEIRGIDPSIFFDNDDEAYIVYNSDPPDNKSMYSGHRTIRINKLDPKTLKVIGDNRIIVNGGTDFSKNPVWIEAPHLLKKDGRYYLYCAEGGTGYNHSEVVFRARTLDDLFIPYENNPILTQRHLDRNRPHPITTTGHADLVEDEDGNWWGVFLGCRPYKGNHFNTGRETFMAPVIWKDGWPVFDLGGDVVKYQYPIKGSYQQGIERFSGNYTFSDEFNNSTLNDRYMMLRTPRSTWHSLQSGKLILDVRPETFSGKENPSFIAFRQAHLKGHANTSLIFKANGGHEKAGLAIFQSERFYYFLSISAENGKPVVQLWKSPGRNREKTSDSLMASAPLSVKSGKPVHLKIEANGDTYAFYYATQPNEWKLMIDKVDATFLSTETAGGFVGCMYAMYATSNGQASSNKAAFDRFESVNKDDVYLQE